MPEFIKRRHQDWPRRDAAIVRDAKERDEIFVFEPCPHLGLTFELLNARTFLSHAQKDEGAKSTFSPSSDCPSGSGNIILMATYAKLP
jgi:hypothetical protein